MISTIAVDDEPLALKMIEGYIRKTPFLDFKGGFDNSLSAMEFMEKNPVQLIFLDIRMPGITGTELAKLLGRGPKIVFTTAYEKYALEGFRLEALDYLLKPIGYEEFLEAAQKARDYFGMKRLADGARDNEDGFLFLKSDYKVKRINYQDVLYIEGMKDYVKVYLKEDPRPVLSIISLRTLESRLPASRFMRVHRSFIVNLDHVSTVERSCIVFDKVHIPVSDPFKEKFQEFLNRFTH